MDDIQWGSETGWEKNGGTLDYIEGNESKEWVGVWKMEWDRHHYPVYMYDYTNGVNLLHVQPYKQKVVPHFFVYNEVKCSLEK